MDALGPAATDLDPFPTLIASFLDDLRVAGYASHRLAARRTFVQRFAQWTYDCHVAVAALRADHVTAFVATRSRGRETEKHERATLRRFLVFLRRRGVLAPPPIPTAPLDALADDYVAYLRTDRGLADNSIATYGPCARLRLAFCDHCRCARGGGDRRRGHTDVPHSPRRGTIIRVGPCRLSR